VTEIAVKLDKLLDAWQLTDADGERIRSGSDAMSDLVDDVMRVIRDGLADNAADAVREHVRAELGAAS
jgi:hypothetical protein